MSQIKIEICLAAFVAKDYNKNTWYRFRSFDFYERICWWHDVDDKFVTIIFQFYKTIENWYFYRMIIFISNLDFVINVCLELLNVKILYFESSWIGWFSLLLHEKVCQVR